MNDEASHARSAVKVLIAAPLRSDASMVAEAVSLDGIDATILPHAPQDELAAHGAVLVCTQEGLTKSLLVTLQDTVRQQPAWARLPVVLLLDRAQDAGEVARRLGVVFAEGLVTILYRPVRPIEFRTAVRNAIAGRRRELEISEHLERQQEMRRELNHRVKNTVATFHAIYRMTARQSTSLEDFHEAFGNRLSALTAVHDLLYDADQAEPVLHDLISRLVAPYTSGAETRIRIDGENTRLEREHALTIALIVNELATNAVKYGALSHDDGSVDLSWRTGADAAKATLTLRWVETSPTASVVPPTREGYGTRFIKASLAALRGTAAFDYRSEGLEFVLTLPLGWHLEEEAADGSAA